MMQASQVPVSQVPNLLITPQQAQMMMSNARPQQAYYHHYTPQSQQMPVQLQTLDFDVEAQQARLRALFEEKIKAKKAFIEDVKKVNEELKEKIKELFKEEIKDKVGDKFELISEVLKKKADKLRPDDDEL